MAAEVAVDPMPGEISLGDAGHRRDDRRIDLGE
jgi:hypothetical protein